MFTGFQFARALFVVIFVVNSPVGTGHWLLLIIVKKQNAIKTIMFFINTKIQIF